MEVHERNFFEDDCVVNCLVCVLAPCERSMTMHKNSRDLRCVTPTERLDNHVAGLLFILARNFRRGHFARAGNFAVEIVSLRRAERRNSDARLCKARCPTAVRMDNAAAARERLIEYQMRRRVARRLPFALNDVSA